MSSSYSTAAPAPRGGHSAFCNCDRCVAALYAPGFGPNAKKVETAPTQEAAPETRIRKVPRQPGR